MTADLARKFLVEQLSPRYGEGEAKSMVRIVFEDAFDRGRAFEELRFKEILERLVAGEPLQYVLGEADFFGLKFKVSPAVLIPRQETEELVAWVLESIRDGLLDLTTFKKLSNLKVLDIGLGSGCIGITLKKKIPGLQLFGLEKSPAALNIALENASQILGAPSPLNPKPSTLNPKPSTLNPPPSTLFLHGDILNHSDWDLFPTLDVVVSNPPYIPDSEKNLVPEHVMAHEPSLALFVDDPDPLQFYRVISDFALEKLRPGGILFFECNEFNASDVALMLRKKGFSKVEIRKDLSGAERMAKGVFEPS